MFGRKKSIALLETLQREESENLKRIDELQVSQSRLNAENLSLTAGDSTDEGIAAVRKRAKLRAEYEACEAQIAQLKRQVGDGRQRQRQMAEKYEWLQQTRKQVISDLAGFRPESEEYDQALARLAGLLRMLYRFEGEPALIVEAERIERDVESRNPWFIVPEPYVWNNGRLLKESDPENVGSGRVAFGKGAQVEKSEALRLGLLEVTR
jgi:chromosome segregation ATPase